MPLMAVKLYPTDHLLSGFGLGLHFTEVEIVYNNVVVLFVRVGAYCAIVLFRMSSRDTEKRNV